MHIDFDFIIDQLHEFRHHSASGAQPMISPIGTHFHKRNTHNPTLDAGCKVECEPGINIGHDNHKLINHKFVHTKRAGLLRAVAPQ